ncbi:MAG: hypothetical protein M0Z69_14595 [Actinomycetota bacterium]|nr:hypothetical protein [Actinomycetota bacterium]
MEIWFYDHPTAVLSHNHHEITVHNASCAYCDHGQLIRTKLPATWYGPFSSLEEAERVAATVRRKVKRCQKCLRPAVVEEWALREQRVHASAP